jgi:glycine/D-amino acid oxidase-like deaminating enzyme
MTLEHAPSAIPRATPGRAARNAARAAASRREDDKVADPAVYGATGYEATALPRRERGRLTFDLDVDVCVVGGGLAGLTTAREVARRGWSVAVLESRRIAWSASGRNNGVVLPGFAQSIDRIIARVGIPHARALWDLSERGLDYVRRTAAEIPGADAIDGALHVFQTDQGDRAVELFRLIGEEIGAEVEGWPTDRVRALLRSERYFHALHYPRAFHLHALNYALGLAAAAEAAGVRIFEETPALAIDPAGVRKRVVTPSARVRAAHVVLAGGAHLGALMPRLAATVLPLTHYVITTVPLGERLADAIAFRGAVSDSETGGSHYRIVDGDRLQWSGRATAWSADPRRVARGLQRDVARTFPALGPVEVAHAWGGTVAVPVHGMPQLGELAPGLWLANGFAAHGLNTTAMAGELIARAVVEHDQTWRLFLPFDLVWAGGVLGRTVVQGIAWGARLGDAVERRLSRRVRAAESAFAAAATAPVVMEEPELTASLVPDTAAEVTAESPRLVRRKRRKPASNGATLPAARNRPQASEPSEVAVEAPLPDGDRPAATEPATR